MQRRGVFGLLAGVALLTGCGFQLKRAQTLGFASLALMGFAPRSPMAAELTRAVEASGSTRVVEGPTQAEAVFHVLNDSRQQLVASTTAAAQVRDLTLVTRLRFKLTTADPQQVLIPEIELVQTRDLSYAETRALGKQEEIELLHRAMQSDIVQQVMRRLAAVVLPPAAR